MKTMPYLPKAGEVIYFTPVGNLTILAYVVNVINNTYYLYAQNRLVAIETQHIPSQRDPDTGEWSAEEDIEISVNIICDYCVIPEADYILKRL